MSNTDPIADMLTRIRNAYAVGKDEVSFSNSKVKQSVLSILKESGFVANYSEKDGNLIVGLKYHQSKPAIEKIDRISKPGRRIYVKKDEIPVVLSGQGISVISTSQGVMVGDQARKLGLGGELIAKIY